MGIVKQKREKTATESKSRCLLPLNLHWRYNVLFLSSVKVGEFSTVLLLLLLFFFFVCITCTCEAKIGLAKCHEHAKNIHLVSSMSRSSMFFL